MKRATKILTVVTLAASAAPAVAEVKTPERWDGGHKAKVTAVVLENVPYLVAANTAPSRISWGEYGRFLGETAPLVGPDGRPGCGNVMAKSGPSQSPCLKARTRAFDARVAAAKKSDK